MNNDEFQELIWEKGRELYRPMPWRDVTDPYFVLVSELMLQQTQVDRVIPKFNAFIEAFPDVFMLASASLADVLILWSGLGYNRRAKYLHEAAKQIISEFSGVIPSTQVELMTLPGVGPNTSAAILAYSFNQPVAFIETNIRTVYFQYFFPFATSVSDKELLAVVESTFDREHPREWYWALMDYGSYLKRAGAGQIDKSTHYKKQSPLQGSIREVRGQIIRALTVGSIDEDSLAQQLGADNRFTGALDGLIKDGMVQRLNGHLQLTK